MENSYTLRPCPFCGGKAVIEQTVISRGTRKDEVIPLGARLIGEVTTMAGKKLYRWEKYGYVVHCTTKGCVCRSILNKYKTEKEAVEKWNRRDT